MGKVKLITAIASISLAVVNLNHGITTAIATENEVAVQLENNARIATENGATKFDNSTMPDMAVDGTQLDEIKQLEEKEIMSSISTTSPETTLDEAKPDGEKLYKAKACNACHGEDAQTPAQPFYPKLAGQQKEYIITQMKDFQSGMRNNGSSIVMKGGMAPIKNEEEIEVIAEWLESLTKNKSASVTASNANNANGAKLYRNKICSSCHGEDAKSPILPFYPKLAGQNQKYAITQMRDIKSGKRNNSNSAIMKGIMHDVNRKEIKAIAEWLSSLDW